MAKPEGGLFYRTPSVKTDGNEKSFGEIAETLRVLPRPLGRGKNAVKEIIFHALKGAAIFLAMTDNNSGFRVKSAAPTGKPGMTMLRKARPRAQILIRVIPKIRSIRGSDIFPLKPSRFPL
jgi:hypothetical protein